MDETPDMVHPRAKFLCICVPLKLEDKLLVSKIHWWDRHRLDIPILKGRN